MKNYILTTVWLILALLVIGESICAGEASVKEILRHADMARGNLEGVTWDVRVTSKGKDAVNTKEMTVKARDNDVLVRFTNPSKMKNQMILMKNRIMWFIRPGLSKPVSISPRQKLMGNAANGDIASTNYVYDYVAALQEEDKHNGEDCYILDLKALSKQVTYDRIKYWVSKSSLTGVKAEFYTVSGKLFKTAELKYDNSLRIDENTVIPFVSELIIRDAIQKDEVTTLFYSNIKSEKLPDSTFNIDILLQ